MGRETRGGAKGGRGSKKEGAAGAGSFQAFGMRWEGTTAGEPEKELGKRRAQPDPRSSPCVPWGQLKC